MPQANPLFPVKEQFPVLDKDISVDVAVIGGGIAGVSSAYNLANKGYNIALLEEQEIGAGATGASSGILYYGTGTDFTKAIELFGREKATMIWKESKKTIETITQIIEKNSIECGLRKPGAIMVAKNEEEQKYLEEELKNLKSIGFDGAIVQSDEIKNHFTLQEFVGGLEQDNVVQIAPALFISGLAKTMNLTLYISSPMINYKEENNGITIETPKAKVRAQKILFATNRKPFFGLESHFFIENSVILATKKLNDLEIKKIWPKHKIIWSTEEKYDIIYEHDSRAILELYYFKGARDKIKYYFPNFEFAQEFTWGDSWSKTSDWLPIVGKIKENLFAAIAMGDQGIVVGFMSGMKMSNLFEEKQDEFLEMASPNRFNESNKF